MVKRATYNGPPVDFNRLLVVGDDQEKPAKPPSRKRGRRTSVQRPLSPCKACCRLSDNSSTRGVCLACYGKFRLKVKQGKMTWDQLVEQGRVLPTRRKK